MFPVERIDVYSGFPITVATVAKRTNLKKIAVSNGTSTSHIFNIVSASKTIGTTKM